MAKYKLNSTNETDGVFDTETGLTIPNTTGNRHWFEYQQWKLGFDPEGNQLLGNPGIQIPDSQYTLSELKVNKKSELKQACREDIEGGFSSTGTGTLYTYESSQKDQVNISGAAQSNVTLDFTVIDGSNNKIRVSHTATQMNQVFVDGVTEMQTKKSNLYTLLAQVDSAVDEAAVNLVVYS
jgi:hypothetical protein